jgi:tRNA pseudouridine38-40 synthase
MPRYKLIIEYDGSPYHGWQFQKDKPTVMGVLMDAIKSGFSTDKFELYGSGRTDSGVHALAQVAHLELKTDVKPDKIRIMLNDALPATVNILSVEKTAEKFHARYDAKARSYVYHICTRRTAFGKKYAYWIRDFLDIDAMAMAGKMFEGLHDFSSFGSPEDAKSSTKVKVIHVSVEKQGASILIHIVGSHFLWKMVRRMVGVIIECGRGNMNSGDIKQLLEKKSDFPAKLTVPPAGLFLENVYYEKEPDQFDPHWPLIITD